MLVIPPSGSRRWYWSMDGTNEPSSTPVTTLITGSPDVTSGVKRGAYHVDNTHTYDLDLGVSCIYDGSCPNGHMVSLWVFCTSGGTGIQTILSTGADDVDGSGVHISWDRASDQVSLRQLLSYTCTPVCGYN